MSKYTIGIDLGGTTMTAGLVDENYKIIGKTTWATRLPRPAEELERPWLTCAAPLPKRIRSISPT